MSRVSKAQKVAALAGVPLFSGLTKRQLSAVAAAAEDASFEPGAVLVKELQVGQRLIVIREGTAKVLREGIVTLEGSQQAIAKGASRRLGTVGPGDIVGELSIIDGSPTSASVIAETPMETLIIYRSAFIKLFDAVPQLCRGLLVGLASRLRAADHRADLIS
jgi:CRP-like cAMP-binding protein